MSHYLPIDHLPRQKAVLLLLEQSGEYSRQSQLNYDRDTLIALFLMGKLVAALRANDHDTFKRL
ncbi:MAG: hypothetical protein CM15mP39_08300 [Synechococcus sp.]|nr:MAG: hypothetical protein CM15mP39_08300 [Synechococcus sp.]